MCSLRMSRRCSMTHEHHNHVWSEKRYRKTIPYHRWWCQHWHVRSDTHGRATPARPKAGTAEPAENRLSPDLWRARTVRDVRSFQSGMSCYLPAVTTHQSGWAILLFLSCAAVSSLDLKEEVSHIIIVSKTCAWNTTAKESIVQLLLLPSVCPVGIPIMCLLHKKWKHEFAKNINN